jgi:hypothetical protein
MADPMTDPVARDRLAALLREQFDDTVRLNVGFQSDPPPSYWLDQVDRLLAAGVLPPDTLAKVRAEVRALGTLTPKEWDERRGGDPIARTINAVEDILDHHMTNGVREANAGSRSAPFAVPPPAAPGLRPVELLSVIAEAATILDQSGGDQFAMEARYLLRRALRLAGPPPGKLEVAAETPGEPS